MSASELKNRVVAVLDEQIEKYANMALNLRRDPGRIGQNGSGSFPPTSTEDIAIILLEANSFRRGVEAAKNAVIEEHQKLIAPDSIPSELGEEKSNGEAPFYA